jgi:hypothetical protein
MLKFLSAGVLLAASSSAWARPQLEVVYVPVDVTQAEQTVEVGQPHVVALEIPYVAGQTVALADSSLATCTPIAREYEGGKQYLFVSFEPEIDSGWNGCSAVIRRGDQQIRVDFGFSVDD